MARFRNSAGPLLRAWCILYHHSSVLLAHHYRVRQNLGGAQPVEGELSLEVAVAVEDSSFGGHWAEDSGIVGIDPPEEARTLSLESLRPCSKTLLLDVAEHKLL